MEPIQTTETIDPIVLRIAKTAILSRFDDKIRIDKASLTEKHPFLAQKGASFVTLNKSSALRGCIGSIVAHQPLIDDLIANARSAAFSDPRFSPLSTQELRELELEVSLLSEPEPVAYSDFADLKSRVRPFQDGLILKAGAYQGTFLPQVWEQLPSAELFLEHLALKAGANPSIYEHHPDIYRYEVRHISERFDAIREL